MNRRILPQQTSQIYMYTSFFRRERHYDPFRSKEIINRGIRYCNNKGARYTCIARSLSVSDTMTRLERKKLSVEGSDTATTKEPDIHVYSSFFKRERQHDPFRAKEIISRRIRYCNNKRARYTCIARSFFLSCFP